MGGEKSTTKYASPYQDILRQVMAGGLPSVAKGYMENVAIPTTMNAATKMGLGRSGGALEAVAHEAWKPGVDIMHTILGLPGQPVSQTKKKTPGMFDWLGLGAGLGKTGVDTGAFNWMSNLFKGSPSEGPAYRGTD